MVEELKDNELSTGLLLGEKPASEDLKAAASSSITVTDLSKWHGFDITRKGGKMKKKRYIFALPMMLTNNAGGTLGTVTKMDTPTPVLYIEFPEGRFKCLGRISKTGSRFMPLELTKKSVECKDIIEIMVVFSTVYWVGKAEDNPDEEPLPVPSGLLQAGPAESTLRDVFKEGVGKNIKGPQRRSGPRVSKGKAKYDDDDDDEEEDDEDDDAIDLLGEDDEDREVEEKPTAHKASVNTSGRKRPAPRGGGRAANTVKRSRRRVSFADDDDEDEDEEGEGDHAMEVDGAGDREMRRSVRSSSVRVKYNDDESEQDDEQGEETEDEEQQQGGKEEGGGREEEGGEGSEEDEGRGKEHDEDAEEDGDEEDDEHLARKGRKPRREASMGGGAAVEVDDDDDDVEVVEAPKPKRANKAPAPKVKPQQRKPLSIPTSKRVRRAKEENDDENDDDEDEEEDDDDDSDFSG